MSSFRDKNMTKSYFFELCGYKSCKAGEMIAFSNEQQKAFM